MSKKFDTQHGDIGLEKQNRWYRVITKLIPRYFSIELTIICGLGIDQAWLRDTVYLCEGACETDRERERQTNIKND